MKPRIGNARFWNSNGFAVALLAFFFIAINHSTLIQGLERTVYDWGVKAAKRDPGDQIAIIAIDDESIANIGRWPWPRSVLADMTERLQQAGARTIAYTLLFSEPQVDAGLAHIQEIHRQLLDQGLTNPDIAGSLHASLMSLENRLQEAEKALDTDTRFAEAIARAGNVIIGSQFIAGPLKGRPDADLPEYLKASSIPESSVGDRVDAVSNFLFPTQANRFTPPIPVIGKSAAGIGHLMPEMDIDGAIRSEPLVLDYYNHYIPSMALLVATHSLNLSSEDISILLGEGVQIGNLFIETDPYLSMKTFFYQGENAASAFAADSFYDVYQNKIALEKYRNKIVLIGPTAYGLGSRFATPISPTLTPVDILAHNVASILNEDYFIQPLWATLAGWAAFLVVALYLVLAMPKLSAALSAGVSLVLLTLLLLGEMLVLAIPGIWVPLVLPAILLASGHLVITTRHYLLTERGKQKADLESAESNKMLGLAFQQQGQLDMAFEKFRKAPLNEDILDPLYNLALDFERKRHFNKAAAVYQYMQTFAPDFRDIPERLTRAQTANEQVIFGTRSGSTGGANDTLLGSGGEKPMLGRYVVEKELGRGAMGVVYQGRDPKINRVVAIKTLALSDEFEAEELDSIKERFFTEAEAAGKLNHPNIVTIFDAGEEHDLAYIAMELLEGGDLADYVRPDQLLPVGKVLTIIAQAALALDYAHQENVVHRDIKPANIMYDAETGKIKITDFGIARVSNASRTKTGMVVGTPNFMSPEQVKGLKVDGRSDLFSLGIMMYQMLAGDLPFQGDSAATTMYQIATEPHPDILQARPALKKTAPWVAVIINRALEKDLEKRYQRGSQMARDIKACLKKMQATASSRNQQAQPQQGN